MPTLYDQAPDNWEKLAASGYPALRDTAKLFSSSSEMDRALGLRSASQKWLRGLNGATSTSERRAREFLDARNARSTAGNSEAQAENRRAIVIIATERDASKIARIARLFPAEVIEV